MTVPAAAWERIFGGPTTEAAMEPERRRYYGIPQDMTSCPCGDEDCAYFAMGYPYCMGCGDHHRMPVARDHGVCPVDTLYEESTPTHEPMHLGRRHTT